jgi:Methyltransferase domain
LTGWYGAIKQRIVHVRARNAPAVSVRPTVTTPFETYSSRFGDTPGYFQDGAIATWDFLLTTQRQMKVAGNFLEIGVLSGKSALLAACHMQRGEWCILNDINPIDEVVAKIRGLDEPGVEAVLTKSLSLPTNPDLGRFHGTARWIHIDGDHDAHSVTNDLRVAELFLADRGVICVDDFFSGRYPQLTAAVYKFLFDTAPLYRMVLCGAGKCYLVRSADYTLYEGLIRKHLAGHLHGRGQSFTIHKSTYAHDMGCFSIGPREADMDYCGRDADTGDIPF